jgi:hypothetical protein
MKAIVKNELVITQKEREAISTLVDILEDIFKLNVSENVQELAEVVTAIQVKAPRAFLSDCGNDFSDIDIEYVD